MILKSILIQNYGPFSTSTEILFDRNLTILTGQNDVGKSSIIKLLRIITNNLSLIQDDVNIDHLFETNTPWEEDTEINCLATYTLTEKYNNHLVIPVNLASNWKANCEIVINFYLAPKQRGYSRIVGARDIDGKDMSIENVGIRQLPKIIVHPMQQEISSTLNLAVHQADGFEKEFLLLAFGQNYSSKLMSFNPANLGRELRAAGDRMTQKFNKILPTSMGIKFVLNKIDGDTKNSGFTVVVSLQDTNDSETYLHLRGSGVKKIIQILVSILDQTNTSEQLLIVFDEPENSLHANAQHTLRAFLETLSLNENIQIIYATHSPSMINPMQAHQIRLFERANKNGKATTIIHNQPITENFHPIRTSLGLSPTDSLLYAPITIIVEGATEVLGLPILLKRLYDEKVEGFELIGKLFSLSHILDGNGSSFKHWCGMAISQGCKPIIFVAGDKHREVIQQKVNDSYPDVPIILLDKSEFEEIVPQSIYFQALKESLEINEISLEVFSKWDAAKNLPAKMAFSKRIDIWLGEIYPDSIYYKWDVMKRAIEKVDLADVNLEPFRKLVQLMIQALNTSQT